MTAWLAVALAATGPPPCEPLPDPERYLAGEHFWISWGFYTGEEDHAAQILDWAHDGRRELVARDWRFTDRTVLIRVVGADEPTADVSTFTCPDGAAVPSIELRSYVPGDVVDRNLVLRAVALAAEQHWLGSREEVDAAWAWWADGTATWLAATIQYDDARLALAADGWLADPQLGLHQPAAARDDRRTAAFLDGTALFARHLETVGGPETVRATWEHAAAADAPIDVRDAVEGSGLAWTDTWTAFLASATVVDLPFEEVLPGRGPRAVARVDRLPAAGRPAPHERPEGLGAAFVQLRAEALRPDRNVRVDFAGDPDVPWLGVLVRTGGPAVGGRVLDVVPLDVDPGGRATATLEASEGDADAWLVVSPQDTSLTAQDFAWSAELALHGRGHHATPGACGCAAGSGRSGFALVGLVAFVTGLRIRRTDRRRGPAG